MVRDGARRSQVYAGCACYGAPPHHEAERVGSLTLRREQRGQVRISPAAPVITAHMSRGITTPTRGGVSHRHMAARFSNPDRIVCSRNSAGTGTGGPSAGRSQARQEPRLLILLERATWLLLRA